MPGIKLWPTSHPKLQHVQFNVFAKSAMEEITGIYKGRPHGGSYYM